MNIQLQNLHISGCQALVSNSGVSGSVHVRFLLVGVALGQDFLRLSPIFLLIITIPPFLGTHVSPLHGVCDSHDQATHYHSHDIKLGASPYT
jgi:hypothetical protein